MQYPDWLRENEKKVPESEYEKYSKQHSIIEEILREYEAEKSTDTDEVKSKRHERIMDKMQKVGTFHPLKNDSWPHTRDLDPLEIIAK